MFLDMSGSTHNIFDGGGALEIHIKNCNSIDEAKIVIKKNKLNIKFAANGTGKSTLAKAIKLKVTGKSLTSMTPFKYRIDEPPAEKSPEITITEDIKSIQIFNEEYINQFIFKEDELVSNSFEIFIKTESYESRMRSIEEKLILVKKTFIDNEPLKNIIDDISALTGAFGNSTKTTPFHGASPIAKGIGKGNKLANLPDSLKEYTPFFNSKSLVTWLDWQIQGNEFIDIADECPYCVSNTKGKKEIIKTISKQVDSKSVKHLSSLKQIIDRLRKYFSAEAIKKFDELFNNSSEISNEGKTFLGNVKNDLDTLLNKLLNLRSISFFTLKDADKVETLIKSLTIDLSFLPSLNSAETLTITDQINKSLHTLLIHIGQLQGEVIKQNNQVAQTIKTHKVDINSFLQCAGYKYQIEVVLEDDKYKLKLHHIDSNECFSDGGSYLSFGERNAFAMILFMYQCLKEKPDLIVMDDPISSFDKSKKYALLDTLFRSEANFKNKTVLMLTHDLEPIIDMVYVKKDTFRQNTTAAFLENQNGIINEILITSADIISFSKTCANIISSSEDEIIKLIHLRRYFEINHEYNLAYQLLSSLFHKEEAPTFKELDGTKRPLTEVEIQTATNKIKEKIAEFDYSNLLKRVTDKSAMIQLYNKVSSRHSKLQIFRIIKAGSSNNIITKFINETYHIENDYVMQLNPMKYDTIPQFIVDECTKELSNS